MQNFLSIHDVEQPKLLLQAALDGKQFGFSSSNTSGKTLTLLFFNPSLRTRMSTQKAAQELGMHVQILNIGTETWQLEFQNGAIMNGSTAEHIKEAAMVVSEYSDIIGIRTFAGLVDRNSDYQDEVLQKFLSYASKPVISLESAIRHPLQSFADIITIQEECLENEIQKPKVVVTWAPHIKPLPQAVTNSFLEWGNAFEYDLHLCRPKEYALDPQFESLASKVYDNQEEAFEQADFIYVKNWSQLKPYGGISKEYNNWMISEQSIQNSNSAKVMHCLPVRRNVVIADDVLDNPHHLFQSQVANRIIAVKTVLNHLI